MPRQIVLLRGINVGANKRIAMPELHTALAEAGFEDVATYVQSGNITLRSAASPAGLAAEVERLINERFGLQVPVEVRTHAELAAVVAHNPFPEAAENDPKHYQVTFLSGEPEPAGVKAAAELAVAGEMFTVHGRELYAWHPAGIHSSKLAAKLNPKRLGVENATARNWATVTTLLEMSGDAD